MSKVRGGQVFVEIGADPRKFFSALGKLNAQIAKIGQQMQQVGARVAAIGAAAAAPFAAAVVAGSKFEDTLLAVKASTGATASELAAVKNAAMATSEALGVGPTQATQGFLELLKAGMSLGDVLGGAGQAALQFAKVGEMDVPAAAVVMADAMKVFGVSADTAANTLSAAADASSTSIQEMTLAFSQSSAVAALANQSMGDLSAALAILANNGVKGSDAGTSVKTMLMRLMAPADDAVGALDQLGLSVQSFRGADGQMKPMVEIIRTLTGAMAGMDQAARDDIFRRIFGQDAIRAAAILTSTGADGFEAMRQSMAEALPVSEKYKTLMSGLSGAMQSIMAATMRVAIAVSEALGPSLMSIAEPLTNIIGGFAKFVETNQELIVSIAKGIAIFTGVGLAIAGVGAALSLVAGVFGLVLSPLGAILAAMVAAGAAFTYFAGGLSGLAGLAETTFGGVYAAIAEGDLAGAMDVLWAGLYAGWLRGVEGFMGAFDSFVSAFPEAWAIMGGEVYKIWDGMWTSVSNSVNMAGAYLLGAFDNIINPIMAMWDALESGIRKTWIRISGIFKDGEEKQRQMDAVDAEMAARAEQRAKDRPGMEGRAAQAQKENDQANRDLADRQKAVDENTQATIDASQAQNAANADARRQATQEAEADVGGMARGKRETRARNSQFAELLKQVEGASSLSQLRELYEEFDALSSNGRLTSGQTATLETALEDAQERISKATSSMGGESAASQAAAGAGAAGQEAATSSAQVAGTFSSMALGGMGFGSSLGERQLKALETIASNTSDLHGSLVAE